MYDLFSMEKLLESAKIAEKIADGVVDDQAYNVLTQCVNEEVLIEGRAEVESILENASEISGEFDLDQLAKEVKEALPEAVAPKVAPKVAAKAKVAPKAKVEATAKKECAEACKDKCECKGECECKAKTEAYASNPGKPAAGMDSIEKFLNAAPVKQKDFVDANTNSEHTSSGSADKAEVDKNATSIQKEMVKDADSKKKFEEVAKKQNKVNLTESINKFKGFVESIKTDENTKFVDAVLKGFDIIWK